MKCFLSLSAWRVCVLQFPMNFGEGYRLHSPEPNRTSSCLQLQLSLKVSFSSVLSSHVTNMTATINKTARRRKRARSDLEDGGACHIYSFLCAYLSKCSRSDPNSRITLHHDPHASSVLAPVPSLKFSTKPKPLTLTPRPCECRNHKP